MISSSFGVLVADIHGSLHLLNRNFESTNSWVAHVGGRVTHMIERKGILITLGVRFNPVSGEIEISSCTPMHPGRRYCPLTTSQNMGPGEQRQENECPNSSKIDKDSIE